ncbi:hypothetical protein ACWFR5_17805 [Streptomyces sp. NPDC055092]
MADEYEAEVVGLSSTGASARCTVRVDSSIVRSPTTSTPGGELCAADGSAMRRDARSQRERRSRARMRSRSSVASKGHTT